MVLVNMPLYVQIANKTSYASYSNHITIVAISIDIREMIY